MDKDGAVKIHHRNLQKLAIEMYRSKHKLSPGPILKLFEEQHHTHDLRHKRHWQYQKLARIQRGDLGIYPPPPPQSFRSENYIKCKGDT